MGVVEVAANLKKFRVQDGRSARELSVDAGLAPGHVWTIESGGVKRLEVETIKKLAKALKVRPSELDEELVDEDRSARQEGEQLFIEDVEARTPHRLPAARDWLREAAEREYVGSESWGRMVWFRRYLEDWNAHRKGGESSGATPATKSGGSFADRRKAARERKEPKGE